MDAQQTIATKLQIAAPLDRIWSVLTDFATYQCWNPYIVKIDGPCEKGATITVHAKMNPDAEPMAQQVRVIEISKPVMRWEGGLPDKSLFRGDHLFALEQSAGGMAFFKHSEVFTGTMAQSILADHGAAIADNFRRFNEALKLHCEAGARP